MYLRIGLRDSIEFGYDQPRLAFRIIEYIENGKFVDTQKFAEKSPWGNISWGPSLFLFYTPFLLISRDPIILSVSIALFNLLSILLTIFIGKKFFSSKVGLIAGLTLATQPWWFIFSRMIYQPTPIITIVSLSMFLFFAVYKNPKSLWYSLLIFSWIFLIELYAHSVLFVGLSAFLLFLSQRLKLINKYLFIGLLLSTTLIIPYFYNFNRIDYLPDKNIEKLLDGRDDYWSRLKSISNGYLSVVSGGSLEYQLGYGYIDFSKLNPKINIFSVIVKYLTVIVILYSFFSIFFRVEKRFLKLSLFLWVISPIIFLTLVRLPSVPPIPRYFLISLPPLVLLWGVFISELKFKILLLVPIFVSLIWLFIIHKYDLFIKNYNFPNGHLSVYSDTQYIFLKRSIDEAINDSQKRGYKNIVISNDQLNPKAFSLDWSSNYVLTNVYKFEKKVYPEESNGYYVIDYSQKSDDPRFEKISRNGPLTTYYYNDL